jgi:mannose/fructose/N-acetylgalactosamine-specific phosphotransferase system component IIC
MEPLAWLLLGALGAWAALDGVAAGQFMVSRPLVTGSLTGVVLGDPWTGFLLGLLLEIAHLGAVPTGGVRLPEPGPAAIPAAALAVGLGGAAGMALGTALGMLLALVGGAGVVLQRRLNGRLVEGLEEGALSPSALNGRLALSLLAEASRGVAVTLAGLALVLRSVPALQGRWPLPEEVTWAVLLALLAYPAGVLARSLAGPRSRTALLAAGGLIGMAFGIWGVP